jgi:hypothetical protein
MTTNFRHYRRIKGDCMRRLAALVPLALLSIFLSAFAPPSVQAASRSESKAGSATPESAAELPIHRVVLYKNGVGYFEHRGRVTANQELNIRFTTAQLNDVLKSLTIVDQGGGTVGGVRYNSIAPLSQRLGTLRLALDGNTDRASFLNALRGARVEVHAGASSSTGRLLSVEEVTRQDKDGRELKSTQISLVSDTGELRSFDLNPDLSPAASVRILDSEMTSEVSRYMALLASARDQDLRQMTISTSGEGERDVLVSYISEVPVWKSTYRIVLSKEADALLQGWAVVDNTVGEDWRNVQLSLVAGAPQSFVEPISQPYYVRRPVVELPRTALLTPQTHEGTLNEPEAAPASAAALQSPPPGVGPGRGGGIGGGAFAAKALKQKDYDAMRQMNASESNAFNGLPVDGRVAMDAAALEQSIQPQASGEALGDMFEYNIRQNVTVLQNQSALVPIVQARVQAEKVTLWNERHPAPVRALWLTNSSGLTLDAGSFNIVESGAFAGEGLLAEIHPDERRLLSYAADTAVRVKQEGASEQRPYTHLRAARGILYLTRELRETRTYTVANSDAAERSVVIEHPARSGWHFLDADLKPEESSGSYHRFRVRVAGGSSGKLEVAEYYPQETTYALNSIDNDTIGFILKTNGIQPEVESALRSLLAKKDEIASLEHQLQSRREELGRITQEQARIRENMKTLKGTPEEKALLQRYVASLNQQEDRLAAINSEISAKEMELVARQREYQQTAELMTFDQTR